MKLYIICSLMVILLIFALYLGLRSMGNIHKKESDFIISMLILIFIVVLGIFIK